MPEKEQKSDSPAQDAGLTNDANEKQAQDAFLKAVFDAVTEPLAVINRDDHTISMANKAYGGDAMVGKRCFSVSHRFSEPCTGNEHPCPLAQVCSTNRPVTTEHVHFTSSGEPRNVEVTAFPVFDSEGVVTQIVEYCRDITDRKQAEETIRRQLAEKDTLLREVHHRIKNNIAAIESLLSLQAGTTAHAEVNEALQDTMTRVQSMRVLYDRLLLTDDIKTVSIKNYTDDIMNSLATVFDPETKVTMEKQISDFRIDAGKAITIGIIINELLTNTYKYAFENHDNGRVSVSITKEADTVTLIIQDNGRGFDTKILENESTGFGLTIVRMLIE